VFLSDYVEEGIPFYRGKEISELKKGNKPTDLLYITEETYSAFKEKYGVPQKGDLLITAVGTIGNTYSIPDNNPFYFKDGNLIWLRKIEKCNSLFIEYSLEYNKNEIEKISSGSTQKALTIVKLKILKNCFPSLPEQTKIADFLTQVDEQISLLTEKVVQLQLYKKGVMQKLFSQELRFKDENGKDYPKWEEKKLEEVLTIQSGKDYKHLKEGNIPVYGTGGIMLYVDSYLYDGESVGIGRKGTIDKPVYLRSKFWTVDTLFYTTDFINTSPKFIYYNFLLIPWEKYNEASGVPSLSKKTLNTIVLNIPSLPEQIKIENFLTAIDERIVAVEQQVVQSRVFKKGLLQGMFV
jgi:type I restriction enzyme S subunit